MLKNILITLISLTYWVKFTLWQYIFWNYPDYTHLEEQELFIEKLNFPFLENAADLYLMGLIQLPILVLNIYLIHSIQNRIKPMVSIILLAQGYFSALLSLWQLL
tara:strand:+ start:1598 stop:1912 length:315 start_codon:yes stop_codon:yes gene_type:complete